MAEEEQKQKQQKQEEDDAQARMRSKVDTFISECYISPSQEEILRRIPGWPPFESQEENPTDFLTISQETTPTSSHPSAQDHFTVGSHPTIMYTPNDTQNPDEKEEEEEESQRPTDANENDDNDSFEYKFESDRELSLNTQSQNCGFFIKSISLGGLILNAHLPSPVKLHLPLPEASSAISKKKNSNPNKNSSPKPASCRRILDKEAENAEIETTHHAKSLPDIVEDSPINIPIRATQLGAATHITQFDSQPALHCSPIGTQLPSNSNAQCVQNYAQTDSPMPFTDNIAEEHGETNVDEGFRDCRILPPYFTNLPVQRDTTTELEKITQTGLERDIQPLPKRRRKERKPFPETLMDVIMNYSGEPPLGFEDVDIVEAAIKAGMTFPPPLSRHCFET